MKLKQLFFTENECYKRAIAMNVVGLCIHSTGANNPKLSRYVGPNDGILGDNAYGNHWNICHPGGKNVGYHQYVSNGSGKCAVCGGIQVCVHGFIGKDKFGEVRSYQTLPWTYKGWHGGGSINTGYIGVEICEDGLNDAVYFEKVYQEAVELYAMLCTKFGLDPLKGDTVVDHARAHKMGKGSNHADVGHWFPRFGKSLATFRQDIKNQMEEDDMAKIIEQIAEQAGMTVEKTIAALGVLARFANTDEAEWEKEGADYLINEKIISSPRDGREMVEFGELGVILRNLGLTAKKKD